MKPFDLAWSILKNDTSETPNNKLIEEYHRKLQDEKQKELDALWDETYEEMPEWYTHGERAYEESAHELRERHEEEALQEAEEKDKEYDADYWARKDSS